MWITKIEGGLLTLQLEPSTCLALADACAAALRAATTDDRRESGQLYLALRFGLEAAALVADAHGRMAPDMNEDFTVAAVRREWGGPAEEGAPA